MGTDTQSNTKQGFNPSRLMVIGFDCAERTLVEKWMKEGYMPNLRRLHEQSAFGTLASTADTFVSTPWPTLVTSQWPVEHGFTCWMQWNPATMQQKRCDPSWVPFTPFYRRLGPLGKRVVAIDIPMAYPTEEFEGIEVASWGSYDKLCDLDAHPKGFLDRLQRNYMKLPMGPEMGELRGIKAQLKLRDELIAGTEKVGDAARDLLKDEEWDLFMCVFGATHRAGHNFWDHASFKEANPPASLVAEYDNALRDTYTAADRQLGKLMEVAPDDARIICIATHGMGPTTSRYDLMPELMDRIMNNKFIEDEKKPVAKPGLLKRLRGVIPVEWRSGIKRRLPATVQDKLTKFWVGSDNIDWSKVRAFSPAGDLEGYIRVNLKGRERDGIVTVDEYEPLLKEITEGFLSWKDAESGQSIVEKVIRGDELWPEVPAERRKVVPDLIIRWNSDLPLMKSQKMISEKYGTLFWETADKCGDGRSGHHVPNGWVMVKAEHLAPGSSIEGARGIDMAPTIMDLLDLPPFEDFRGNALADIVAPTSETTAA